MPLSSVLQALVKHSFGVGHLGFRVPKGFRVFVCLSLLIARKFGSQVWHKAERLKHLSDKWH